MIFAVACSLIYGTRSSSNNDQQDQLSTSSQPATPLTPEQQAKIKAKQEANQAENDRRLLVKLNDDISAAKSFVIDKKTLGSDVLAGIKPTQAIFDGWANDLASGKGSKNTDVVTAAATLKKEASRVQSQMYPIMRKVFAKVASKVLWSTDGDMQTLGADNGIALFISGEYAANRNILKTVQSIGETLYDLRFTQVRFKWYEASDEYTFYNVKTPDDSEVIAWPTGYSSDVFVGKE